MSENEQVTEDQKENVGEDAAGGELPVGPADVPPHPPEQTAEEIAAEEAEKDAQAQADSQDEPDPAENDASEATPEDFARDQAASDAEIVTADEQGDDAEPEPEPEALRNPSGLPQYRCYKQVSAFKIGSALSLSNGRVELVGINPDHSVIVDAGYVDKHRPQIGGYYVRYQDGYLSWSPAAVFEDGHTLVD
jgi:hypothetical protein